MKFFRASAQTEYYCKVLKTGIFYRIIRIFWRIIRERFVEKTGISWRITENNSHSEYLPTLVDSILFRGTKETPVFSGADAPKNRRYDLNIYL